MSIAVLEKLVGYLPGAAGGGIVGAIVGIVIQDDCRDVLRPFPAPPPSGNLLDRFKPSYSCSNTIWSDLGLAGVVSFFAEDGMGWGSFIGGLIGAAAHFYVSHRERS